MSEERTTILISALMNSKSCHARAAGRALLMMDQDELADAIAHASSPMVTVTPADQTANDATAADVRLAIRRRESGTARQCVEGRVVSRVEQAGVMECVTVYFPETGDLWQIPRPPKWLGRIDQIIAWEGHA